MAKNTDFHVTGPNEVTARFVNDSLRWIYSHGKNPELDRKVESAYENFMGIPFDPKLASRPNPFYLHGFPGHAKTTSLLKGGQYLADMLDMNLVTMPDNNYVPSKNDFVLIVQELSGEVSNIEVGGIPSKEEFQTESGDKYSAMVKITKPQIMAAREAGASLIIYDDVASAGASVVNSVLSVAQFGVYQGISFGESTVISFTGNYGALDGTNVSKPSSALDTRCQHYNVEVGLKDWIEYEEGKPEHQDQHGTGFITEFLDSHPELFHVPKETHAERAISSSYPSPRTWSSVIGQARATVYALREMENNPAAQTSKFRQAAGSSWQELESLIRSHVGDKVVSDVIGWYQSKLSTAEPLARLLIEEGKLPDASAKILKDKAGDGIKLDELSFQTQFVNSMVDHSVRKLSEQPNDQAVRKNTLNALYQGLWGYFQSSNSTKSLAFNKLGSRLAASVDELSTDGTLSMDFVSNAIDDLAAYAQEAKARGDKQVPHLNLVKEALIPALTGSMNIDSDESLVPPGFDS